MKVKLLNIEAKAPVRMTEGSAGYDFFCQSIESRLYVQDFSKRFHDANRYYLIHTGVCVEVPDGYVMLLTIRSSLAKKGYSLIHGVGIIDSDYRGEIIGMVKHLYSSYAPLVGDRCLQGIVVPCNMGEVEVVSDLSETKRGAGGFGSTGK